MTESKSLHTALTDYIEHRNNQSQPDKSRVLDAFYKDGLIRRWVAGAVNAQRLVFHSWDDLMQEVAVIFTDKVLPTIQSADHVYGVIYHCIKYKAMNLGNKAVEHEFNYSNPILLRDGGDEFNTDDEPIPSALAPEYFHQRLIEDVVTEKIMVDRAKEMFMAATRSEPTVTMAKKTEQSSPKPKTPRKIQHTADANFLHTIRKESGLTIEDFCQEIEITAPAFRSYLSGLAAPPRPVMDRAQQWWWDKGQHIARWLKKAQERDVDDIFVEWRKRLGVKRDTQFAQALGVSRSSISRLYKRLKEGISTESDAGQSSASLLLKYESMVRKAVDARLGIDKP